MDFYELLKGEGAWLAPMAGYSDLAFRTVCASFGAKLCYSEMISARALCYRDKKTREYCEIGKEEGPVILQLFGHEPDIMARAAALLEPYPAVAIDINMGCPTPKIVGNGDGCALMRDLELSRRIIAAVVAGAKKPVTVKMRLGWDESSKNAPELARIAEREGAAAICVHGRTRAAMYRPPVDLEGIAEVARAVALPVIANGDIRCRADAEHMRKVTGARHVMIGRGALGNPFIFAEINGQLKGTAAPLGVRLDAAIAHISLMARHKGERAAILQARKHMPHYFKGMPGGVALREAANKMETMAHFNNIVETARQTGPIEGGNG